MQSYNQGPAPHGALDHSVAVLAALAFEKTDMDKTGSAAAIQECKNACEEIARTAEEALVNSSLSAKDAAWCRGVRSICQETLTKLARMDGRTLTDREMHELLAIMQAIHDESSN